MKQFLTNLLIVTYYLFCLTITACVCAFAFFVCKQPVEFGISLFLFMVMCASFEQITTYFENLE